MGGRRGISRWLTLAAAAALLAAGCDQDPNWVRWPGRSDTEPADADASHGAAGGGEEDSFAILLSAFRDPATHVQDAKLYQERLQTEAKWKNVFIIHKTGHSDLYWGRYPSIEAAQKNLAKAKAFRPPSGRPIFAQAIIVPLAGPDIGPPEYNLKNAKGAYSLLVVVYKNVPERKYTGRKRRAVQTCEALRKKGYEAYFHHGAAVSNVTIGTFEPDSVRVIWTKTGAQLEVLDPEVRKLQEQFAWLLLNGNTVSFVRRDPRTNRPVARETRRTYLIRVPGYEGDDALP